ncbi:MAG: hypothetical protein ABFS56_24730, partial [Pseudomonadota bacterium]
MMKKYVLPTVVSLALSSYALAQESSAPEPSPAAAPPAAMTPPAPPPAAMTPAAPPPAAMTPPAPPPAAMTPPAPPPAAMTPPAEPSMQPSAPAKNCQEEMMEQRKAHLQEMYALRDKLHQTRDPEERRRLGEEMRQRQQEMHEKMRTGGCMMPPGPAWGGPSGMPPHYGARQGPRSNPYQGRQGAFRGSMQDHHALMEKRLENIENMLKQVVELLKKK